MKKDTPEIKDFLDEAIQNAFEPYDIKKITTKDKDFHKKRKIYVWYILFIPFIGIILYFLRK